MSACAAGQSSIRRSFHFNDAEPDDPFDDVGDEGGEDGPLNPTAAWVTPSRRKLRRPRLIVGPTLVG